MASLADRLSTANTRPRALELLLIAHLILDRPMLRDRYRPKVSGAAKIAVNHIEHVPPGAPVDPEGVYQSWPTGRENTRLEAGYLTAEALTLTVEDLVFFSRDTVLTMLGAVPATPRTKVGRMLELHLKTAHE